MNNINEWHKGNYFWRYKTLIFNLFDVVKKVYNKTSNVSIISKGDEPNAFLTELDKSIDNGTKNYLIKNWAPCEFGSEESNIERIVGEDCLDFTEMSSFIDLVYIDPLDGTGNFIGDPVNFPHCYAVSIIKKDIKNEKTPTFSDIEASGVYNLRSGTYWVATRDGKYYTDDAYIGERGAVVALDLYQIGHGKNAPSDAALGNLIREFWGRDFGSSALHYAKIGKGISAYYNPAQKPEELLAGYLLVKNSGGITIDVDSGEEISSLPIHFSGTYNVISAKNKEIAHKIRDIILY